MSGFGPADIATLGPPAAAQALLEYLESLADPLNAAGMARFGITGAKMLGVPVTTLRAIARPVLRRRDGNWRHAVAGTLWSSGVHEARILAAVLEEPRLVTRAQADSWAADSDSWDITDQLCMNLLDKAPFAYDLPQKWATREPEFEKRAAFALIACLAWHDKTAPDERFLPFLDLIEREASDERNFVTKAIDWALRHIGKRSPGLHPHALATAVRLTEREERAARRVGRVAAKELRSDKVLERLGLLRDSTWL